MDITLEETRVLLEALRNQYGPGYNRDRVVGGLQAKLSIWLEVKSRSASVSMPTIAAYCPDCRPGRPCYGHGH